MIWLATKLNVNKRVLTLAKGMCAETILHLMKDNQNKEAVKISIAYGNGKATDKELATVAYAAAYLVYAAPRDLLRNKSAKKENQQKTADICREILTEKIFEKIESPWDFKIGALFYLGMIATRKNEAEKAQRIAQEIEVISLESYDEKLKLASIYMGLGERELGYKYLDSFFRKPSTQKRRFIYYIYIDLDGNFDNYKEEERFEKITKNKE